MTLTVASKSGRTLTAADYIRAERLLSCNAEQLVWHSVISPTWLPSGKLWYRTRTARGISLVLVDPARRTLCSIFDEVRLARAMRKIAQAHSTEDFSFDSMRLSPDETSVSFEVGATRWQCDLEGGACFMLLSPDLHVSLAPNQSRAVLVRDYNLWLREVATGCETQLTTDGAENFGYATDNSGRQRTRRPCVLWSPDSRRIATFRQDERSVGDMYLVKIQRGHPTLESWKYPMPCDAVIPTIERVIIDVTTRRVVRLQMPVDNVRSASWLGLAHGPKGELEAQWSADGTRLAFVSISRDHKCARLRIADAATGAVQDVLEEVASTYYESAISWWHAIRSVTGTPNWRVLHETGEVVWYSSRDNWSHLYLYDLETGRLKHQITRGEWNVVQLLRVDERRRIVYFMAVGREPDRHPYYEHLYRSSLDGKNIMLLTPEDATHLVSVAPSGKYFVDSHSRPDMPPIAVLRNRVGKLIRTLEATDTSPLISAGWRAPMTIKVKARDGTTDLYGLLFKPSHFDAARKYPIVNAIYSSAIMGSVIPSGMAMQWAAFSHAHGLLGDAQALAELGFIVVMIDGIGTPLRSRKFHEATYANYGDGTLPDQVAAMKELGQSYSWIDVDRAGIYGLSGGGYKAARAMFVYPEFFKVGVAISGNHDPMSYQDEYSEKFIGLCARTAEGGCNYDREANMSLAHNLKGHLLLVHGMMDSNVAPYHTLLLADTLIDANKDFDMLLLPRQTHAMERGASGLYLIRRCWDYFVRNLMRAEPPREYAMGRISSPVAAEQKLSATER
jgi:dipeptidyl-peptidase 4